MKRTVTTMILASALVATAIYAASNQGNNQSQRRRHVPVKRPKIDMVIALDTSGSMQGLLNSARAKLWDIVNEAAKAQPAPVLRVALVTYGSRGSEGNGFVEIRSDLTTDLDSIYGKLFELRTWGGTEYVGRVIDRSTRELSWDKDRNTLKQIFVAGNESADQDRTVSVRSAVVGAREQGIFVNAIYCGTAGSSDVPSWRRVAAAGKGVFASIDQDHGVVNVASPYDTKINALSARLNRTYVGYGAMGRRGIARQAAQDRNASTVHSAASAARALAKASSVYRNDKWDLVDARKAGKLKGAKRALPASLRKLGDKALNAYLDKKEGERKKIRKQIVELSKQRRVWLKKELHRRGKTENKAFDYAIKRAVRTQAAARGIKMRK